MVAGRAVLSVGTTHPWNFAGTGLDQRIGAELGLRVLTVVLGVSAQNATAMVGVHPVPRERVRAQFASIPWAQVRAIRVGAFASGDAVAEVAAVLREHSAIPAIVDPVLAASSGEPFGGHEILDALRTTIAPASSVILTPNLREAALLLERAELASEDDAADAALALQRFGCAAVLLKGGHLAGEPVDFLASAGRVEALHGERLGRDMRGTGCALAMALAVACARGLPLPEAVDFARAFVRSKIAAGVRFCGADVAY